MQDSQSLRVGCVKYLNARPLIRGWPGKVTFDHPAALCDQLQRGVLQVALVSSFEFLRNPIYQVIDGVSISSDGPVHSVIVAYRKEISAIEEIELDPASLTSVALLRCLLGELNLRPRLVGPSTAETSNHRRAILLIGDKAIRFRQERAQEFQFWDLGGQWKKIVNLPFVYALWLVRPEVNDPKIIADKLRDLRDANLEEIEQVIAEEKTFDHDFCRFYYRDCVRFGFNEWEKEGLNAFRTLCEKHKILPHTAHELRIV